MGLASANVTAARPLSLGTYAGKPRSYIYQSKRARGEADRSWTRLEAIGSNTRRRMSAPGDKRHFSLRRGSEEKATHDFEQTNGQEQHS